LVSVISSIDVSTAIFVDFIYDNKNSTLREEKKRANLINEMLMISYPMRINGIRLIPAKIKNMIPG
jgi:hypothetical protein